MDKSREVAMLELHQAYKRVFESDDGKAVLEDLRARGFADRTLFDESPQRTAFNEGRRSIVLHVLHMADHTHFNFDKEQTK